MSSVHIQVDREVSLCPSLAFPQRLDAFSQLSQQNVGAGHAFIVAILFAARVWHARQIEEMSPANGRVGREKDGATSALLLAKAGWSVAGKSAYAVDPIV